MHRVLKAILVLCLIPAMTASMTRVDAAPASTEVVVLQGVDVRTLDPHRLQATPESNVLYHVFETLVDRNDSMALAPKLAESWRATSPVAWEFQLRGGVRFHNGAAFNAAAAAYSIERANQIGTTATRLMKLVSVEAVGERLLRISTAEAVPILPHLLLEIPIVDPGAYRGVADQVAATRAVGTGPYTVAEWRRDDRIVLVANNGYWGGAPLYPRLVFRPVPEAATRVAELEVGNAHLVVNVPAESIRRIQGMQGATVKTANVGQRCYIGMRHHEGGPLADSRVRRALNHAVDVDTIVKSLLGGYGERRASLVNPPYASPNVKPFKYDPALARQLIAEAGYGSGFKMRLMSPNGRYPKDLEISQAVAQYWRAVGVQTEVQTNEWTRYIDLMLKNQLKDAWHLCSVAYFDGELELNVFMGSLEQLTWYNRRGAASWKLLQVTVDDAKRRELLHQLQELMLDDPPVVLLHKPVDIYGASRDLDWTPRPDQRINLFKRR
jgi:peptide/nickel transport system substrate-binding protein